MDLESEETDEPTPAVVPSSVEAVVAVELSDVECRVVGALIEKAFTTPDVYPMTTNAMVTACNQKSNRDPVVAYDAVTVDGALLELRQRNIVRRVHTQGSRSTKHRQTLDEVLGLDPGELALMSVLLLRGDQTIGELRLRTERQIGFDSIEAVQVKLDALAGRSNPLVRQLARQPGQKEARWRHLIAADSAGSPAADVSAVDAEVHAAPPVQTLASSPTSSPTAPRAEPAGSPAPAPASGADDDVVRRVAALESEIETLRKQLRGLADQLGEPLA